MKVLIDTNVYLSYILAPGRQGVIPAVVAACLTLDDLELLVPPEQLAEFVAKVTTKRFFRSRIPHAAIDQFVAQLKALGDLQPLPEEVPAYGRDPKDDYLVAYGIMNEADYLVTGDQDLLVLQRIGQLQVVTPVQFRDILRNAQLLD